MQINEVKPIFLEVSRLVEDITSMVSIDALKHEVDHLDRQTYDQDFWSDVAKANKTIKRLKGLKQRYDRLADFVSLFEDIEVLYEFIQSGESMLDEFEDQTVTLKKQAEELRIELLLNGENDGLDAILEIHPGAGGTESQDWASMLYRMYMRFAESNGFTFELLDYLAGEEAGIKRVTFAIRGTNSFGYLKAEHGVHRLVRISPFDSGGRRHTSFASVTVIPEIDDSVEVELLENELKIDTYRSSGAGGQSVNTTDSAVRVTHIPTGTVVTVQNERSQIKNRETALNILKGKLYMMELAKKQEELSSYRSDQANAFGSQIRSYVMHPYSMVKDHRTNEETGNVQKVMDGDVMPFIQAYLKHQVQED
ncbi:peptide chain release factor 2 [Candidatus Xianfuyuplasma coldseepsis]|uniref:Peptide chain release factor 2 n=1 Tax=Candidatus Xianfuyuplasma coldseepsis TaxID=2782163 RepID=A0A7L7KQS5_9MOLU|nr:peptide chain release factor 2 [Xianfuyuplasma coldseepsis]QMS84304.1 peptide chain release factor 2 [Xianfuyuplasma coldseepsis]